MKDRVPLKPGRVKITPEGGGAAYYATMERADQPTQEGDPLNKATLLKDATAALFGLGTDAVPDDALAYLGKYAQHWWRRRLLNAGTEYITPLVEGAGKEQTPAKYIYYIYADKADSPETIPYSIQYSDNVICGADGKPTGLATPIKTVSISPSNCATAGSVLKGKFVVQRRENKRFSSQSADVGIAYIPASATIKEATLYVGTEYAVISDYISIDITAKPKKGEWEYLQSNDDDAYPHSGESSGYEYEYLGIPFDNAATAPKIATGSYVGTGTYGADNPNSLTFEFEPKVVIISTEGDYTTAIGWPYIWGSAEMHTQRGSFMQSCHVSVSGNTMNYYNDSDEYTQLNTAKQKYPYIALG